MALGKDVFRLILPKDLSRIHPVFHTSVLLPFVEPMNFPNWIILKAPRGDGGGAEAEDNPPVGETPGKSWRGLQDHNSGLEL
ncbi:hypothetical protein VP01_1597g1 [Puccinia sorghi]|uniref:Uncharacterized protein n=1 Tax=Puccinia sorghi TaxID=27349 RepID=A0A0L6VHK6_9BASI|nr:hypothetical protein VP01_1597g1 [Puccinia sorghi]